MVVRPFKDIPSHVELIHDFSDQYFNHLYRSREKGYRSREKGRSPNIQIMGIVDYSADNLTSTEQFTKMTANISEDNE